jgi:hypothetical protein
MSRHKGTSSVSVQFTTNEGDRQVHTEGKSTPTNFGAISQVHKANRETECPGTLIHRKGPEREEDNECIAWNECAKIF